MLFITGPLYSGKRTFAQKLGGTCCFEVQKQAETTEDLEALAKILSEKYDIITATEVGGGVVPVDATERAKTAKKPAAWHACSPRMPIVLCRCSAAFRLS